MNRYNLACCNRNNFTYTSPSIIEWTSKMAGRAPRAGGASAEFTPLCGALLFTLP